MATYTVRKMRVVKPTNKMAEKHPNRWATVFGEFYNEAGVQMSITCKVVDLDTVKSPEFSIDLAKGILTLPDGQRGKRSFASLTEDDILAELTAIRNAD